MPNNESSPAAETAADTFPVGIALGSNLGDRSATLRAARTHLSRRIDGVRASPIYESPPMYRLHQPNFLNQVIIGTTSLAPNDLLRALKKLETRLGRMKRERFGPREIDLDILFFGKRIVEEVDLCIPHRAMGERAFVLLPLSDLVPDWRCPRTGRTAAELARTLPRSHGVLRWKEDSARKSADACEATGGNRQL